MDYLNPVPGDRSATDAEIANHGLKEGRRHVDVIGSAAAAAVLYSGNLRLLDVRSVS